MKMMTYSFPEGATELAKLTKLTKFHHYQRLPTELKMEIWRLFFKSRGGSAHRFRLSIDKKSPEKLMIRPDKDQKQDASDWREILALARVDRFSFDWLMQFRRRALVVYKDTEHRRRFKVEENGIEALVDPDNDLVTFRFNYGNTQASLNLLSVPENQQTFAGITQIGLEIHAIYCDQSHIYDAHFQPQAHLQISARGNPFTCPEARWVDAHNPVACPFGVVNFLRFFKDLKIVYFIITVARTPVNRRELWSVNRSYTPKPGAVMSQLRLDCFRRLQETAERKNEEQFHDRYGTYCRAHFNSTDHMWVRSNQQNLQNHNPWTQRQQDRQLRLDFRPFCMDVRDEFMNYHTENKTEPQQWKQTEFKYLSRADLRGATLEGDERPVRTPGPPWY